MRISKNVMCDNVYYGKATGYYMDNEKYTFVLGGIDFNFTKSEYDLITTEKEYILNKK